MSRFIETICFEDGHYPLLDYHQKRVNQVFLTHFPGAKPHLLKTVLPSLEFSGRYKVRMVYDAHQTDVEFSEYHIRKINTLQLITANELDYAYKYEDRSELDRLFEKRGEADDILIIKNGLVTDSYYANPVFYDGDLWYVPSSCLLNGVRRQKLLDEGAIMELKIRDKDIGSFQKISLINAMMNLGECEVLIKQVLE